MALVLQGCTHTPKQVLSNEHGRCEIDWSDNQVRQIVFLGSGVPGGELRVDITRHKGGYKDVLINSKTDQIWSEDFIERKQSRGSCKGIVFRYSSDYVDSDYVKIWQWTIEATGTLIYKEVVVLDKDDQLKRREFMGPFSIPLLPPPK